MFKAVITEETTIMNGTKKEKLVGFLCYIDALLDIGITEKIIREVVDFKLKTEKGKVEEIDLAHLSKREIKEILNSIFS